MATVYRRGRPTPFSLLTITRLATCCLVAGCIPVLAEKKKSKPAAAAPVATKLKLSATVPIPAAVKVSPAPGFVYRAEKEGRVIYLAGALHRLRRDAYPLPPGYETAYRQSGSLWLETSPQEANISVGTSEADKKGFLPGWKNVNDFLTPSTRKVLHEYLASRDIKPSEVKQMRPWFLGMYLMNLEYERQGVLSNYGVEEYLSKRAWLEDKPVRGLEKASDSVESLSSLSAGEQDRNLAETLRHVPRIGEFYTAITTAWRQGSETAALGLLRPKSYTTNESWRGIVAARNASWLGKLKNMGAGRPCMVIVGLDHLIGPEGLVQMLTAKGYRVTAVSE
jgi:uncharacterized protein YbaP (TraB family)